MFLEMTIEIGEVLEAALIAYFGDIVVAFHEEAAGVADADLGDVVGESFSGMVFKVAGEGGNAHIQLFRNLFYVYFVLVVLQYELEDSIDLVRVIAVVGGESAGQEGFEVFAGRKEDEDLYQFDQPVGGRDRLHLF